VMMPSEFVGAADTISKFLPKAPQPQNPSA